MNQSEQINELTKALSKAQSEIKGAKQDSKNPYFKSDYADLTSIWNACKDAITLQGLAVIQTLEYVENKIILVTTLAHSSGQWIKSYMPIMATKLDPQGIGSALTYARRYALSSIVGVCPADDDGEEAMELTESDKSKLMKEFKKEPDLVAKFREKLNIYDLTKMSRNEYVKTMEFFSKRKKNKKGEENGEERMAQVAS